MNFTKMQNVIAKREVKQKIEKITFEEIKINDILIVNTGDKIPTDGIISYGNCSVDESMITGESISKHKTLGDHVIGGTIITEGSIKIKVLKIGNETVLSQIINLIKNAQNNKPKFKN